MESPLKSKPVETSLNPSQAGSPPLLAKTSTGSSTVRPIFLISWALVTVALLAEYGFTLNDLQKSRRGNKVLALHLDNPEAELESPGGEPAGNARIAELEETIQKQGQETLALRNERNRLQSEVNKLRELKMAEGPAGGGGAAGPAFKPDSVQPPESAAVDEASAASKFSSSGRIIARDEESDIVAIDLGARDGLKANARLKVFAGGVEIGALQVLEVRDSVSAGRVTLDRGRQIPGEVEIRR